MRPYFDEVVVAGALALAAPGPLTLHARQVNASRLAAQLRREVEQLRYYADRAEEVGASTAAALYRSDAARVRARLDEVERAAVTA